MFFVFTFSAQSGAAVVDTLWHWKLIARRLLFFNKKDFFLFSQVKTRLCIYFVDVNYVKSNMQKFSANFSKNHVPSNSRRILLRCSAENLQILFILLWQKNYVKCDKNLNYWKLPVTSQRIKAEIFL